MLSAKDTARFWSKVDRRGDDECWPWRSTIDSKGYGVIEVRRRQWFAHRLSMVVAGMTPGVLCVLHRCDNPPCVNPSHLFLGTKGDNTRDMVAKGRHARGVRNGGGVKLDDDRVRAIRDRLAIGDRIASIARDFCVSWTAIQFIRDGRTWKHVTEAAGEPFQ